LTHYEASEPINYFEYNSSKLVPASWVIAFAGQYAETLNPKVVLTMLEEQEHLVRGHGGECSQVRYETAMGFDCPGPEVEPKTGNCVEEPDDVGFSQQVVKAAWQLEFGFQRAQGNASLGWGENNMVCYYGPELAGTRQRCEQAPSETFTGEYTFSNTKVTLANAVTATLYAYTPALQPFGFIYLELFGPQEEAPKEEPKEEPPVEKEPPKEEPPVEKPTESPKEKEPVKETLPETTPPVVPSGTPTGMEPVAPVQTPATVSTVLPASKPVAKPKPKAKPKKVCRKHGKKVRCPVKKKTHRKSKKK
jgi:hypothetical protein